MANMGYCRFRNTLADLLDCMEHWDDDLSEEEAAARTRLARLCAQLGEDSEDSEDSGGEG
jgi:hypothetical protein